MSTSSQIAELREALSGIPTSPLDERLIRICEELIGKHRELALVEAAIISSRIQAYQSSREPAIKGRERDADISVSGYSTDKVKLKGEITALETERDLLLTLRSTTSAPLFSLESSRASHPSTTPGQYPIED